MDVRRLDEMQAQGRSIFDTELAVAYYARVSTDKDEQINSLGNQKRYFEDYIAAIRAGHSPEAMWTRASAARLSRDVNSFSR